MSDTYCGKTCEDCVQKARLGCPGCRAESGMQGSDECELARCCRDRGHESCVTCNFQERCGTIRTKERIPEYRFKRREAERIQMETIAQQAPTLAQWLYVLFLLFIPSIVASILTNGTLVKAAPGLFVPGQILSAVCSFVFAFVFFRLSSEEDHYRSAGICSLIGGAVNVLIAWVSRGPEVPDWMLLVTIPASVALLVGDYHAFTAHSIVLTGLDNRLSEKWTNLWKWYIGTYIVMFVGIILLIFGPILGLLAIIGASIGQLVIYILKLDYLYATAQRFKEVIS